MKVSIANLTEGIHEFALTSEPRELDLAENFSSRVDVDVTVDKANKQVLLRAHIQTRAKFHCDRCAEEFTQPLENSYQMRYVYPDNESLNLEADEVAVITPETSAVDITEDVRQFVLLAVPLKLLCMSECKGLCPYCGANFNHGRCSCASESVDPRWDKLKPLLKG